MCHILAPAERYVYSTRGISNHPLQRSGMWCTKLMGFKLQIRLTSVTLHGIIILKEQKIRIEVKWQNSLDSEV